ncbi:MAG TPA: DUF1775 domain-containing protein [Acidimicrobiia bacterium]|nr:DUF1775 domain-containing protein [Acidimicrobiia bacterium]
MSRSLRRMGAFFFGVTVSLGALAAPAWAHVQVEAQPGSPGATDAVLKVLAAGESGTAGVAKLEVVADPAIPADQLSLVDGPTGWTLTPGTNGGFVLAGPALPQGEDAVSHLKVKKLPDAPKVVFKVVQTYSDGEIVRWIELAGADGKEPDHPAPVVTLTAGASSAISPEPADDADAPATGSLARTGSQSRILAFSGGLLLLFGGWSVMIGSASSGRLRGRRG